MKKKLSTEPDLYVINKKPSEKERKEFSDFIKEHKRKQALKKQKQKSKFTKDLTEAFNDVNLHEQGKKKLKKAKDLLNEL